MEQATLCFELAPVVMDPAKAAILAAQAGDWEPANVMELQFLNDPFNDIRPHDDEVSYDDVRAVSIRRGDMGLQVLWVVVGADRDNDGFEPCDCLDPLGNAYTDGCPMCRGHRVRAVATDDGRADVSGVLTDIDGRILWDEAEG